MAPIVHQVPLTEEETTTTRRSEIRIGVDQIPTNLTGAFQSIMEMLSANATPGQPHDQTNIRTGPNSTPEQPANATPGQPHYQTYRTTGPNSTTEQPHGQTNRRTGPNSTPGQLHDQMNRTVPN